MKTTTIPGIGYSYKYMRVVWDQKLNLEDYIIVDMHSISHILLGLLIVTGAAIYAIEPPSSKQEREASSEVGTGYASETASSDFTNKSDHEPEHEADHEQESKSDHEPEKIVGGTNASPGEFKFIVSIRVNGGHICGGSIIGPRHILTAAHCVYQKIIRPYWNVEVVSGTTSLISGGDRHKIVDAITNPYWSYNPALLFPNDIAVLVLERPIQFNDLQGPIDIASHDPVPLTPVTAIGWGYLSSSQPTPYDFLQKMQTYIMAPRRCRYFIPGVNPTRQLCTAKPGGRGVCQGDSGGPLISNQEVVGIVSFTTGTCGSQFPDVFTNVFVYRDFIISIMKQ